MSAIPNLSLAVLRQAYRDQRYTPLTLVRQLRQQALDQNDNHAWITLLADEQLAEYCARLEGKGPDDLPLYGVPFAIKDNIDLAGVPTTAACPGFAYVPEHSAYVVEVLMAAGAIPLGKTNLDQFATGLVGTRSPYGEARNAFNPDYISGGSSAGSALATALGQVSFALGTDTAGSGRVPAVLNNVIGVKPSRGLLSNRGLVPACRSLDCISIFALNCHDAADLLDLLAGYDEQDTGSRHNPYTNRRRYYPLPVGRRFRFGVPAALAFQGNTETEALFALAVKTLEHLGGEAVPVDLSPFLQAARLLYEGPWVAERCLATAGVEASAMLPVIQEILASGRNRLATDTFAAHYRLAELKRSTDQCLQGLDFMLTPTTPTFYTREEIAADPIGLNAVLGTYTNFMNLLDYCGTAVPVGFTGCGVPWGVTLVAPAFRDMATLGFAHRLQLALALPQGATGHAIPAVEISGVAAPAEHLDIVVCGAHLQGQPLNWQLQERGGVLKALTTTAPGYRLYALQDRKRPALIRDLSSQASIEVEVWTLPADTVGTFVAGIPAPLGIGKVQLADGAWVSGFICDGYGLEHAVEITGYGSWRAWLAQGGQ